MTTIPDNIEFEDYLLKIAEDMARRFGKTHKDQVLTLGSAIVALVKRP
jgi:hypothetical protein